MEVSGRREPSGQGLGGTRLRTRALDLLSRRDHSELELKRKLLQKGADASEVVSLFEEFRARGYLDDRRFAENFVQSRRGKSWGPRRFRQELMARGIAGELASEILERAEGLDQTAVREKLESLVDREVRKGREAPKIAASLIRRGFSPSSVQAALRRSTDT